MTGRQSRPAWGPHALKMRPMFVAHVGVCASGHCECGEEFYGPGRGETYRSPTEVANAWATHLQDIQRRARAEREGMTP